MIEKFLGIGLLLGIIVRDLLGFARFDHAFLICGTLLGFISASVGLAGWRRQEFTNKSEWIRMQDKIK